VARRKLNLGVRWRSVARRMGWPLHGQGKAPATH